MQTVFAQMAISLDGYVAGPGDGPGNPLGDRGEMVHEWVFDLASFRERHGSTGGRTGPDDDLVAGLLDELEIHVAPVFLGGGVRLFDRPELAGLRVERTRVVDSPGVTHVRYRVVR